MPLLFSKQPGCHEAHLKRRYHNSLLHDGSKITQDDVNNAHQADMAELTPFKTAFDALLNQAVDLKPNSESDVILKLKEDLDKLYEQCAGLGGDTQAYKKGISKLTQVVMLAVRKGAGDDPTALSELEQEDQARAMHYQLLEHPLVAHMLRPESPIQPEQLAAVLLGEDENIVEAVLSMLDAAHILDLKLRAEQLIKDRSDNIPGAAFAHKVLKLIQEKSTTNTCH